MTSAPNFTFWRTSLRTASTPSATPENRSNLRYGEKPVRSPCPPVDPMARPATFRRGPGIRPASIAFRSATSMYSDEPDDPQRREPGLEGPLRVDVRQDGDVDRRPAEAVRVVVLRLGGDVRVHVDQAREDRLLGKIDDPRPRGDHENRPDLLDHAVLDEDLLAVPHGSGHDVHERAGLHEDGPRSSGRRGLLRRAVRPRRGQNEREGESESKGRSEQLRRHARKASRARP